MSWGGFRKYVSVAKRKARAEKAMNKLRKSGQTITPIEIEGNKITKTFWGKAWCDHLEQFSDYANRLPRGRTYARNGSVCHLEIQPGVVKAIVSGSELYQVKIDIKPLDVSKWKTLQQRCTGQIGSLVELLGGNLSDAVMTEICDSEEGLMPLPFEIEMTCDCPDWAEMCKHIAAVLYGIGHRLDTEPDKIFELRRVDATDLIDMTSAVAKLTDETPSQHRLGADSVNALFDIDLEDDLVEAQEGIQPENQHKMNFSNEMQAKVPKRITGAGLRKRRKQLNLTQQALANRLAVSVATISKWEGFERCKIQTTKALLQRISLLWP